MKNLLFALFSILFSVPVFSQDELNWIMWECESTDNNPVGYVPVGHRTTLLRYEASWPNNETRHVLYYIDGEPTSLGQVSGGEHLLEVVHGTELTGPYWKSYMLTLQVNSNSTAGIYVTTEPRPPLEVEAELLQTTEGDSVIVTASSFVPGSSGTGYGTGWGLIFPFCTSHQILMIVEISTASNEVIFRDTIECAPGYRTDFLTGFMYKGPYTELCTRVWMERLDISPVPTFTPQEIVSAGEVCMMAGGSITTGQEDLSKEKPTFLAFPNPCRDVLQLQSKVPVVWHVTNMLSSTVITGKETEIDTRSWPSGMYILEVEGVRTITKIVRE